MLIEKNSRYYLKRARASAKELEYGVPTELRAKKEVEIEELFPLSIACIADLTAGIVRNEIQIENLDEHTEKLYFASKFYDAYLNIHLNEDISAQNYFYLVGATAYYLCNQIGSSIVLAKKIDFSTLHLSEHQLDRLLYLMLINTSSIEDSPILNPNQNEHVSQFISQYNLLMSQGVTIDRDWIRSFRKEIYSTLNYRDIFFIDALLAIFILKSQYSIFNMLPKFSTISRNNLSEIVRSNHFVKEMWPSQRHMCELGLFNGESGVIQMPTGAGKTKAVAMAIYTAFCSRNIRLSIIVAPFRALCREISNDLARDLEFDGNIRISEISDLLQIDYSFEDLFNPDTKTVIITTPEKLLYILRQDDSFVNDIGQLIFDEGHLFDDEERGATYELLISSILSAIKPDTQRILISAIIPNVEQLNKWFTNGNGVAFRGKDIASVDKLPAALRWETSGNDNYCYLYFIDKENRDSFDFFVPRMIDVQSLERRKNERQKYFPAVDFVQGKMKETNDMAIACLLKLVSKDNVAIFCGNRISANKILERICFLNDRKINVSCLTSRGNDDERRRISNLIAQNYGEDSLIYQASILGVFAHHACISDGIKNSVEYALKNEYITNVICTSTLAQGVNLPIKYLIVSSIYQAGEQIKVRDFHNLIGRTARSGMYTEGTIIFSDPFIFQNKKNEWKWEKYKTLLDPSKSEKCSSALLDVVRLRAFSDKRAHRFYTAALLFYKNQSEFDTAMDKFRLTYHSYPDIIEWFEHTFKVLGKIENYLAAEMANNGNSFSDEFVDKMLSNTLAASLATSEEMEELKKLFTKICEYLDSKMPEEYSKRAFAKSMISSKSYLMMHNDVLAYIENGLSHENLLNFIVEMVLKYGATKKASQIENASSVVEIAKRWIAGETYVTIHKEMIDSGCRIFSRGKYKPISLEDIGVICDNEFGYSTSLIINSICGIMQQNDDEANEYTDIIVELQKLSQRLKYGLSDQTEIFIYEVGFNDRYLAHKIAEIIGTCAKKKEVRFGIRNRRTELFSLLSNYPKVFEQRLNTI